MEAPQDVRLGDITIAILTYQRPEMLADNLRGLADTWELGAEVIVVDNSQDSRTADMIAADFPWVKYIASGTNRGVAGRNLGIRAAGRSIVITLDDDVLGLTASACAQIAAEFAAVQTLGALCFRVVDSVHFATCNWCHHRPLQDDRLRFPTYEISEGAVAFRRKAWDKTRGYPEEFFISHEGRDIAYQLMNAGYSVEYCPMVRVIHHHHQSGRPDWRRYYFDTRNQYWLAVRNMPVLDAARYLLIGQASMAIYSVRDGHFGTWLRAVRDGIRGIKHHAAQRVVWSAETRRACREIDRYAPGFGDLVKRRLFRRGVAI